MNLKLLKKSVIITNSLLLLVGLFFIIYPAILYQQYAYTTYTNNLFSGILIFGIVLGVFLILWTLFGVLAAQKNNTMIQAAYNVGIIMLFLLSIAILAISCIVQYEVPSYKNDEKCTQQSILIQLQQLNHKSSLTLCQNDCLCNFKGTQEEADKLGINNFNHKDSSPVRVQDCQIFEDFQFENQSENSEVLKFLEELFGCSGFCSQNSYYLFSDLNDGIPNGDCKVHVINFVEDNIIAIVISSSFITVLLLVSLIFNILFYLELLKSRYSSK
ncbi:tetraspanin family protein (macronuclear) [Tetrahymena thermophila SB210]|uniref:Tetraspanin family protein n=1 Tax=Tetrahymena thermophila (strain SB210) TaxID=312017 RepID=Q24FE3_TETTS|nr:tetraspanin family protein [Tetrahymena thermophila SB210]EAS06515.1 tetraspanin family protein [Tetrahymena thermophila SB210]|eukprot:XP_001026760.1 tetraspanin family protein [Tetrahymena thermophila SB210]